MEALACETIPLRVMPWRGRARRVLVLRFLRLSLIIAGGLLAARLVAAVVGTRRVDGVILAKAIPLNAIVSAMTSAANSIVTGFLIRVFLLPPGWPLPLCLGTALSTVPPEELVECLCVRGLGVVVGLSIAKTSVRPLALAIPAPKLTWSHHLLPLLALPFPKTKTGF